MLLFQIPTPTPTLPTNPITIGSPDSLTTGGLLLILLWIVLNQVPGILDAGKGFLKVIVAERSAKTQTLDVLMKRLDDDRNYYEKERVRLERQITSLQKEVEDLRNKVVQRDERIAELERKIKT